jgi:hypothetical protein
MNNKMPTQQDLAEIEKGNLHPSIFSNTIGGYRLSTTWRRCSAAAYPGWYAESMIFHGGAPVYQGEGWRVFRVFQGLHSESDIQSFIEKEMADE